MNDTEGYGLLSSTTTKASATLTVEDIMGFAETLRDHEPTNSYLWYISPTTARLLWRMKQIIKLFAKNPPAPRLLRKHARRKYQAKLQRGRARIRRQEQEGQWYPRHTQKITVSTVLTDHTEPLSLMALGMTGNVQSECIDGERGLWQHTFTPQRITKHVPRSSVVELQACPGGRRFESFRETQGLSVDPLKTDRGWGKTR